MPERHCKNEPFRHSLYRFPFQIDFRQDVGHNEARVQNRKETISSTKWVHQEFWSPEDVCNFGRRYSDEPRGHSFHTSTGKHGNWNFSRSCAKASLSDRTGFNTGNGNKLSNSQAYRLARLALCFSPFLALSPVVSPCTWRSPLWERSKQSGVAAFLARHPLHLASNLATAAEASIKDKGTGWMDGRGRWVSCQMGERRKREVVVLLDCNQKQIMAFSSHEKSRYRTK